MNVVLGLKLVVCLVLIPWVFQAQSGFCWELGLKDSNGLFLVSKKTSHDEDVVVFPKMNIGDGVHEWGETVGDVLGMGFSFCDKAYGGTPNHGTNDNNRQGSSNSQKPNIGGAKGDAEDIHGSPFLSCPWIEGVALIIAMVIVLWPYPDET